MVVIGAPYFWGAPFHIIEFFILLFIFLITYSKLISLLQQPPIN